MKKHWIRCWSELSDIIASCGMVGRHRVRWTHTDPEEIDDNKPLSKPVQLRAPLQARAPRRGPGGLQVPA